MAIRRERNSTPTRDPIDMAPELGRTGIMGVKPTTGRSPQGMQSFFDRGNPHRNENIGYSQMMQNQFPFYEDRITDVARRNEPMVKPNISIEFGSPPNQAMQRPQSFTNLDMLGSPDLGFKYSNMDPDRMAYDFFDTTGNPSQDASIRGTYRKVTWTHKILMKCMVAFMMMQFLEQ